MPFFKRDPRRKRTNSKLDVLAKGSDSSDQSSGAAGKNKSNSTLNSVSASSTPPSSVPNRSTPNLTGEKSSGSSNATSLPQRPVPLSAVSNRSSFTALNTPSVNGTTTPRVPTSALAPRVISISDNSWVHQKVLLIYGHIGDPNEKALDGTLVVCHHQDSFPASSWPVSDSHFKALVYLSPGPNRLRFDFTSPKIPSAHSSIPAHSSWLNVNFLPLINAPPLQLVILLGKDSLATFDAVPERKKREGNDLEIAIQKFRMAAYLWQAFTGEQMFRHCFGRRCFRFEEEWQTGSLTYKDRVMGVMRNEAKIHVLRSEKTVKELRDLDLAQQYDKASRKDGLFNIAVETVKKHFKPAQGQSQYVSVLLLDSHWDTHVKTITGHAAVGGSSGGMHLAIFGSHALQSYPTSIEEIVPAFSDCSPTNMNFVANDCGESGSNWEAANVGIGAHLHEVGHLFGCPHQESGIMERDFVRFNRTFLCREPYSTRTKSPGMRLCLPKDESGWHRLDALRFKYHPCFRLPSDGSLNSDPSIQIWPADGGKIIVTAPTGVAFVEIFTDGDDKCHAWSEYGTGDVQSRGPPSQITFTEEELRNRLTNKKVRKINIKVFSAGLGEAVIEDVARLIKSTDHVVKLPNGRSGFRGCMLGASQQQDSQPQQVILETAHNQSKLLTSIKVYYGNALDGLEFLYEDSTRQMFGKKSGRSDEFLFDTRRGEILLGFYLRAGHWIDGLEILTSLGKRSSMYGNPRGGSGHTLIPPRGYSIAGISGTCGQWVDGFSLIITR